MARNSIRVDAPLEIVWSVLADPFAYPDWVVGAQRARAADPSWPAPGSRLHHRVGIGPLSIRDRTTVLESDPPRRIVLDAAARPLGRARVEISLHPEDGGTRVEIVEDPSGFTAPLRLNPAVQALIKLRNAEALRRFKDIAERRRRAADRAARRPAGRRPRAATG
jgi:uncharacterized protein YndB with AHSA1/START domain